MREPDALIDAAAALLPMAQSGGMESDPALVALMIVIAALQRRESRGAFPNRCATVEGELQKRAAAHAWGGFARSAGNRATMAGSSEGLIRWPQIMIEPLVRRLSSRNSIASAT
jgi:hypothetical protein